VNISEIERDLRREFIGLVKRGEITNSVLSTSDTGACPFFAREVREVWGIDSSPRHDLCSVPDRVTGLRDGIRYPAWVPAGAFGAFADPQAPGRWRGDGGRDADDPPLQFFFSILRNTALSHRLG